ncbi:hypothetical protein PL11201_690047 [Planktothrix sp. PCC 11201]|uniref:sacsin N-terminal ATP-binding-like domain-containing protein n=1 Tax=Planktothrix sp. PCC 11201 TaxID=1729650 RepID=UPI000912C894|nr:hypothetical protein [Planktothrix sp. PCC 11201]SKB15026.1 hypothetical protein PL11201_690047 [Planktothrix sp. PCC 11201]
MNNSSPEYLSQGIDILDFLRTELVNLSGFFTLAYELIQNAEDSKSSWIRFNICTDALIVENDSEFSEQDFKKMQRLAGGDRRDEEWTIGRFGIGFTSVYQITDHPEIISSGKHWTFYPEKESNSIIKQVLLEKSSPGTRFCFPWASSDTQIRQNLEVGIISPASVAQFLKDLIEVAPKSLIFLQNLKKIEIQIDNNLIIKVSQIKNETKTIIEVNNQLKKTTTQEGWYLLDGNFNEYANVLKANSQLTIKTKRRADVVVAIPDSNQDNFSGFYYAFLPTQQKTELPFHINADFFPTSDRKGIRLEQDDQSTWNKLAIFSAAEIIQQNLIHLKNILGHKHLWSLLSQIEVQSQHPLLKFFWEKLSPKVKSSEIIFTSAKKWQSPQQVCLLDAKEEYELSAVLEKALDKIKRSSIVHFDLRSYSRLLKKVGVISLDASMLADALFAWGLDKAIPINQVPDWIKSETQRKQLAKEVGILFTRQSVGKDTSAKDKLKKCAIALSDDNQLYPPINLCHAKPQSATLFKSLGVTQPFLASGNPKEIEDLVAKFSVDKAIELLEKISTSQLEKQWHNNRNLIPELIGWLENHQQNILRSESLLHRVRKLSIFPSSDRLRPLEGLAIPGSFQDTLNLASLVDIQYVRGHIDFLVNLGAKYLTFSEYACEQVPKAFQEKQILPEACRQLVCQLATHLEEIEANKQIRQLLSQCPLIECKDGQFRSADEAYLDSESVRKLFSNWTLKNQIAVLPKNCAEKAQKFLKWLQVVDQPSLIHICQIINALKAKEPKVTTRKQMQEIFEHLTERWEALKSRTLELESINSLKSMAWLPVKGDETRWYCPDQIFTSSSHYLVDTQVKFLDIDRRVELQAEANKFSDFLGIKAKPQLQQVIEHLLTCSGQGHLLDHRVYEFLQNNIDQIDDTNFERLKNNPTIHLATSQYVQPEKVFWNDHPFGKYRYHLPDHLHPYYPLFQKLGVSDSPEPIDAIFVIEEISKNFENDNFCLDDESYKVLLDCWKVLTQAKIENSFGNDNNELQKFKNLSIQKVIPNAKRLLTIPEQIFFVDRPNLLEKLTFLQSNENVIPRPSESWYAMEAVGVRPLSQAIQTKLTQLEPTNPNVDPVITKRLKNRKSLIKRVIQGQLLTNSQAVNLDCLEKLIVKKVSLIKVRYHFELHSSTEEIVQVYLDYSQGNHQYILYYQLQNGVEPWPHIAREIAYAINPNAEAGKFAAGIKEVIMAKTPKAASEILDALGYAPTSDPIPPDEENNEIEKPSVQETSHETTTITSGYEGTGNPEYGALGEKWSQLFYKWLGYQQIVKQEAPAGFDFLCTQPTEQQGLKPLLKVEAKAISTPVIRITMNEWTTMMNIQNREKYELLIVVHTSSSVEKIIRVMQVWSTFTSIFSQLKEQDLTSAPYKSEKIDFLIGLQRSDPQYPVQNDVLINWKRLIDSIPHPNVKIYCPIDDNQFKPLN